jgi:cell wall-associated NlpC family hydrolase
MRKTTAVVTAAMVNVFAAMAGGSFHGIASASGPAASGTAIVQTALKYVGSPYTATGSGPRTGFNDVGLVRYVYRQNGIPLHIRVSSKAYKRMLADGPRIGMADLQPGDLVFFKNTVFTGISHVGIYMGDGEFIHAEWFNRGVTVSLLSNDPTDGNYWATHYKTANRPWAGS